MANLIGGVFVVGHNMSNQYGYPNTETYVIDMQIWDLKDDCYKFSSQQADGQESPMLSFLVFGVIPPVAYGYAFYETSDKDFTMVVVAVVSFVCVGLEVAISGVSYAAGNLAMRLIEKLGLFETDTWGKHAAHPRSWVIKPVFGLPLMFFLLPLLGSFLTVFVYASLVCCILKVSPVKNFFFEAIYIENLKASPSTITTVHR
ncbi:hypothetical protein CTI12_AA027530 [Artemisia annua]|uniref:Uncharacterized protein n=1 Tax=Artemisia annua TaxID=35608 RepID=A0A2U1QHZ4_ARTAN|nr:hypothetical protein CTI12_AA027530 [Artemisia annua]